MTPVQRKARRRPEVDRVARRQAADRAAAARAAGVQAAAPVRRRRSPTPRAVMVFLWMPRAGATELVELPYPYREAVLTAHHLGHAPKMSEIKSERDALMRTQYGSMLLTDLSLANDILRKETDEGCVILSPVKFMGQPRPRLGYFPARVRGRYRDCLGSCSAKACQDMHRQPVGLQEIPRPTP
jgi:hypothetical protein